MSTTVISSTVRVQSHASFVVAIQRLASPALSAIDTDTTQKLQFTTAELWLYILKKLRACNGNGYAPPLLLEEFMSQQLHRYKTDPSVCREAWSAHPWHLLPGPVIR